MADKGIYIERWLPARTGMFCAQLISGGVPLRRPSKSPHGFETYLVVARTSARREAYLRTAIREAARDGHSVAHLLAANDV